MDPEDPPEFCKGKGFKLVTLDQTCPDGPSNPPVGGTIDGDNWVRVVDGVERWVQIGQNERKCYGHYQWYGDKEL